MMNGSLIDYSYWAAILSQWEGLFAWLKYGIAGVTEDLNPFHVNEEYSNNTFFKGHVAHCMLLAGFISIMVGCQLPGPGAIYVRQKLKSPTPA